MSGYARHVFEIPLKSADLPASRGPLSELVTELVSAPPQPGQAQLLDDLVSTTHELLSRVSDPLADDDLQLALYVLYGLHYRSFEDVEPGWEWNPAALTIRSVLEVSFAVQLEAEVALPSSVTSPDRVGTTLFELEAADQGPPLSRYLEREGSIEDFREFVIHRSAYQLKEADPHSWAIPRLTGAPKAAMLEVQFDEYGSGRPERMHSQLFARTMESLDLDSTEDFYLSQLPGSTLATVNLMSWFGLHRKNRGALVGHLAMFEMSSSRPNRAYGNALRRHGFGKETTDFYDEHVEADAVHENIAAYDMAGGLAIQEPDLTGQIVFGAAALLHLEARFAAPVLEKWKADSTSLLPAVSQTI